MAPRPEDQRKDKEMGNTALKHEIRDRLHISHSQIRTYLMCSQKYYFQYVAGFAPERQSVNLAFGRALHSALERHYRALKTKGVYEERKILDEALCENLEISLSDTSTPWVYNSTLPDLRTAQGVASELLSVTLENATDIQPHQIMEVEFPLAMPLHDAIGDYLEVDLVGIVDLLLKDEMGNPVVVDHKTAKTKLTQDLADWDLQMSAYGCLLEANGLLDPAANLSCRFDVMRKLKTPVFERVETIRTSRDRRRFEWIVQKVLAGIAKGVFIPNRSWLCSECPFADSCSRC